MRGRIFRVYFNADSMPIEYDLVFIEGNDFYIFS